MKRYAQVCPLARALDVIGDRWNLLVIRELMIGPRRYTDLLDGLPGIGTNILASHLRDLQTANVVAKRTLPPPAAVTVYELTPAGRALSPTLDALRQWGAEHAPPPRPDDAVRAAWLLMGAIASAHHSIQPGRTCDLDVGSEHFQLTATTNGNLTLHGPPRHPDANVHLELRTLYELANGRITATTAGQTSTITGDHQAALAFLAALAATTSISTTSPLHRASTVPHSTDGDGPHR